MRVYISSTPDELEHHRSAARDVVAELGFDPMSRDPAATGGLDPVAACASQVASADLALAIVGWRRGRVPSPELRGDGLRFWAWWEVRSAFDHGKPVVALMAADSWRPELREDNPRARAVMRDFRGELERVAVFFGGEDPGTLPEFRGLVRRELIAAHETELAGGEEAVIDAPRLRRWSPPQLPDRPYPVLLPYTHPGLMAGRERELEELGQVLARRLPIVGLHAPSGTGKSSLLAGGLVPHLRAEGRLVAFDRRPAQPGLADRLLDELLDAPARAGVDPAVFVDRLVAIRRIVEIDVPLLVVDQFEDLLKSQDTRAARAQIGRLLAASVQRQPTLDGPLCQWLLAYRREVHGELLRWLSDALRDARAEGLEVAGLPHELSRSERFFSWPLQPFGTARRGSLDAGEAPRVFLQAI